MSPSSSPRGYEPRLARRSSGDEAALLIRRMIFDGELRPGARVPQDDVAAMLGISRIPVREALIALEREGWVTIEMHRGAFVNALDARSIRDHYELFGLVYGFAARKAIERSDRELVDRLSAQVRACDATQDPVEFGRSASAFQAGLVDAAQSPRIKVLLRAMSALVPGEFFALVPDAMAVWRRGFMAVLRAIRKGDADAAADECQRAMRRVGEKVVAVFAERGLFESRASA
ncbi:MAG: GntR family transcriptional regulator [Acidimicrobiia bacterium]|nr:GntR family transcriptional regulator [Acidimicrobiia bacterium]